MTGTDLCVNKPHKSQSYLNLVHKFIYVYNAVLWGCAVADPSGRAV
jgi:hypothetical protein